jgi:transposase-like protein
VPQKPLSSEQLREALDTVAAHGGNVTEAALALGMSRETLRNRWLRARQILGVPDAAPDPVDADRAKRAAATERTTLQQKYDLALRTIERQERELGVVAALGERTESFTITPRHGGGTSEGTVVVLASDWHVEETVGAEVGDLNRYDLDIAKARAVRFWQSVLRLTRLLQQDIRIEEILVGLLGDFITGQIHEDNAEKNALTPNFAIVYAQNLLISGIEFLLEHTTCRLTFVCHSGNHARTTHKTRFGAENGHSLEYLMYLHLAAYFRGQPRVSFVIPEGMHSYVQVYDQAIRFQHGHAIKYGGGVGGIFIPANKAVAQWDRARRADLSVFGHFHQFVDAGSFICNGSLIGYNSFALSIKASFEPPRQALFLMDKRRGKTCVWPVIVSETTPAVARKKAA